MKTLLFDFSTERSIDDWVPIHDAVMGGVSTGRLEATGNETVAFAGLVSLENNGGFASVRSLPREHDLSGYSGLELRIRGDGRRYKINLRTDPRAAGILYRAVFETRDDEWQTLRLPFEKFVPTFRGRIVREAPSLDLSRVTSLGLMISDGQAGPFRLEIAGIGAYVG
jgi:NADH dehydrogenase [ubiquinone] 1 alpha subcomplex assembly factor 1